MTIHNYSSIHWLDSQLDSMIELLESWVNINSGSGNLLGIEKMIHSIKRAFHSLSPFMEVISIPPRSDVNKEGNVEKKAQGNALFMKKHPHALIQVLLGGHLDTVYPETSPFQRAERLNSTTIRGPGVADMKGGLVILLKILETIERSPYAGKIGWELFINSNEETGSVGMESFFEEAAKRNQMGLLFEPAMADGSIVSSRKGSFNFSVVARGKSAHAGRDFHLGKNAITALSRFIIEADKLNNVERGINLNVGEIRGGEAINIVPDLAICKMTVRMVHREDLIEVRKSLDQLILKANGEEGISLSLFEHSMRPPKIYEGKSKILGEQLQFCAKELKFDLMVKPSGGVCDGNLLSKCGLPTIDSLGVIGGNLHTNEEYAQLDSLLERSKLTALFLMKLANREFAL